MEELRLRLRLDIEVSYNPIEQREELVEPLKMELGDQGTMIFGVPGFTITPSGDREFDNASLDIVLYSYQSIRLVERFLRYKGLFGKAKLTFRDNNYNLLEIFPPLS